MATSLCNFAGHHHDSHRQHHRPASTESRQNGPLRGLLGFSAVKNPCPAQRSHCTGHSERAFEDTTGRPVRSPSGYRQLGDSDSDREYLRPASTERPFSGPWSGHLGFSAVNPRAQSRGGHSAGRFERAFGGKLDRGSDDGTEPDDDSVRASVRASKTRPFELAHPLALCCPLKVTLR